MKSERRHELQHNELAMWLIKSAKAIQPYQNLIFAVMVVALVAMVGYTWWSRNAEKQTAQAWDGVNVGLDAVMSSGNLDKLIKVAEDYPDKLAGRTAAVLAADVYLAEGCDQRFHNKAPAEQKLSKAVEFYEFGLKQSGSPLLQERATFGLARAKESKGELEAAERYYRAVVKDWPSGAYAAAAQQRIDDLKRLETRRMYDDFARFTPKQTFPGTGMPQGDLPDVPSLDLPDVPPVAPPGAEPNTLPGGPSAALPGTVPGPKAGAGDKTKAKDVEKGKEQKPAPAVKPGGDKKPTDNKKPATKK
jgi:hypothetical protein